MKRIKELDSIKFILVTLVVIGHFFRNTGSYPNIRNFIYIFHMPLFIIITGYTLKKSIFEKWDFLKIKKKTIMPFFIFQIFYLLLTNSLNTILTPYYHLWYIYSLFLWCVLSRMLRNQNMILISIIMALLGNSFSFIGYGLGLSRTIIFFPFFVIGLYFDKEKIIELDFVKMFSIIIITSLLFFYLDSNNILNLDKLTRGSFNYRDLSLSIFEGIIYRILYYVMAISYSYFILKIFFKNKITLFSDLGKDSFYIYIYHVISMKILLRFASPYNLRNNIGVLILFIFITITTCFMIKKIIHYLKFVFKDIKIISTILEVNP